MSEKEGKFQSKSRKFGGGGKGRGRPDGGGFSKRSEGDRGGFKGGGGKRFGGGSDKPRSFGSGERKPRFDSRDSGGGERKPFKKREWSGDRPQGADRPRGDFKRDDRGGDRPFKKPFRERDGGGSDRPFKKPFHARDDRGAGGDRPFKKPFRDRDAGGDRPFKKPFDRDGGGDKPFKKPFRDRDAGGDRPFKKPFDRDGGGDRPFKKPFRDRDAGGDRPFKKSFDRDGGGDKPFKKPFDRDSKGGGFGDRPERPIDSRVRDKGDRHKPYQRSFDNDRKKKPFGGERRPERSDVSEVMEVSPFEPREASADTRGKLESERPGYGAPSSAFLYGVHAVSSALQNPRRVMQRLLVTDSGFENIREAYDLARNTGLKVPEPTYVESFDIERLLPRDAVHQGILLDAQPPEEVFLADVLIAAPDNAKILVLDQVTDPHNVGAILRSAAAFGAIAVVVQKLHAPEITGIVAKSASGAVEHVPMVREVNLSRALEQLKDAGFFCIGLAEEGKDTLSALAPTGKTALVLGAEGEGLRRLVAENCDTLAKLPTSGPIGSLNVSNAAAVALYELARNG